MEAERDFKSKISALRGRHHRCLSRFITGTFHFSGILKRTAKIAAFRQEVRVKNLGNLRVKRQSQNTFYLGSVNLISWHFPPHSLLPLPEPNHQGNVGFLGAKKESDLRFDWQSG